ncbi:zeta toxin family protein [Capnocytophaga genosp. AHN8471]|uniref:zeta toxin family protein n=1 Tax=Capnocytophaga genosp. AHN8471 TaxID=327574 RepID=UPI0019349EA7|nr:zeta toxin family protein [Capnocytophaga genosp. AHN8471]MBM0659562.1 zeta toxin family protein [Capnocytophaga genosp. AHN8471]
MSNKKQLYIIAGCNGAGKTTASFTILPEVLDCKEFINADEIAKGLSPFQPESVAMQAGRIMLARMDELLQKGETFAFETTLATKSYKQKIEWAQANGYEVTLLFFWLCNVAMAKERVAQRVAEGGHNIPLETIERRYYNGIANLFAIYIDMVDICYIFDNSEGERTPIAKKYKGEKEIIYNTDLYNQMKNSYEKERS